MPPRNRLEILFEDPSMIVANKPPGMPATPGRDGVESLLDQVRKRYGEEVRAAARMDRETSGVLCCARDLEIHRNLAEQFKLRTVEETYLALARGTFDEDSGEIDIPITNDVSTPGQMICAKKRGKPATTQWKVLIRFRDITLLEVRPITARTHQIRLHLAHIGHALAADPLYGNGSPVKLSTYKGNYRLKRGRVERPLLDRTGLHAWRLSLDHPTSGERCDFTAPAPKDMRSVISQLRGRSLIQDLTDGMMF